VTNVAGTAPVSGHTRPSPRARVGSLIGQTEIDLRLFGMVGALVAILLTFHVLSGGTSHMRSR